MAKHAALFYIDRKPLIFMAIFPLLIFYYESLFRIFTVGGFFHLSLLLLMLFSFAYGGLVYLLTTLFRNRTVTHILSAVLMGLLAVPYLTEYFVYRQFKEFYDLNTVVGGASDAMSGFSSEVSGLLLSWDGVLKFTLYFLPLILYLIFGRRLLPSVEANANRRIGAAAGSVACYGLCLLLIFTNGVFRPLFSSQYNFQQAVHHFGLITSVGLDLTHGLDNPNDAFEQPSLPTGTPEDSQPEEEEPVVYDYNKLELKLTGGEGRIADLNEYVSSLPVSQQNAYTGLFKGKNLVFISAEAFTAEVIDPALTPTLYRLATKGIQFTDYYQPASAGTTGGEYQNIFGMLPTAGGKSFKNTSKTYNYMTIGSQLDRLGYYGKAFHNNSYTYYSRHQTHINLGYSDGYMGYGNGMEQYVKNLWPQSDAEMLAGTLPTYIDKQPFNVYYMSVSGHGGYSRTGNSMTAKHWERVAELPYSDEVKGYLAANLDLEDALTYLVDTLEQKGIADDTVICISADHFPYGLDKDGKLGDMPFLSELYGYSVDTLFQRDHSRLILWCGSLEEQEPIVVDTPTFSLDILPTLSNLFGTAYDSRLFVGRDVFSDAEPLVFNTAYDWKTAMGTYYASTGEFVPTEGVSVPEGYVEQIRTVVRNKIRYCEWAADNDYFRWLFAPAQP